MSGFRQGRLVALREMRERSRSKGFRVGLVVMLVLVVASIAAPSLIERGKVTKHVGFTGATPGTLSGAVTEQGKAVDVTVRVHRYDSLAAGEKAVRDEKVDVLVVDAKRLEWRGSPDERLRAVVSGAIQLVAVRERAASSGIDPSELLALVAPVPIENKELGLVAGRSPDNETAAIVMSLLLFVAIIMYGSLVLSAVAEEKSSRVVEVLLARMPARNLLAGKVAGIGLLGFAQFVLTALAALVAAVLVRSVDLPAVSGGVLAWVIVWFVLGYAIYAMAYGALGSLASRTEDASTAAGPASYALITAYWASYIVVANDPDGAGSKLVSFFPATAPFAMPGRVALGAAAWWEPVLAAALTAAAIGGLAVLAGRVYTGAILHTGPTLKLRDAWRETPSAARRALPVGAPRTAAEQSPARAGLTASTESRTTDRQKNLVLVGLAAALGVTVFAVTHDFIIGLAVGAGCCAVASRLVKARPHAHR